MLKSIVAKAQKKLRGEYDEIANQAVKLIQSVEKRYFFDSGVRSVIVWPSSGGLYFSKSYWWIGSTIKVPDFEPGSIALREYVFHELGHAIHDHFDLRGYLSPFTRRLQSSWREYHKVSALAADYDRLTGFVSGYARCNREEDFCETFSAYLCNNRQWSKKLRFNGNAVDPTKDQRLIRKLSAVHSLLGQIGEFG